MSYAAAIDQLNAMVPELYAAAGQARRKFSLDEVRTLLDALGNPQTSFRSVLIAGTNGKGSTASTLASILTVAGHRTGLYTSPHLERPNERVRVDREEIADADFARFFFLVSDSLGLCDNWKFDKDFLELNPAVSIVGVDHSVGPAFFISGIPFCLLRSSAMRCCLIAPN